MNPLLKNTLAVVFGLLIGGCVNMGLVMLGPNIIPPPAGVNLADMESLAANIHLFDAKQFIFPFLAHALGTLVGAFVAYKIAATRKSTWAFLIGGLFLLGGIMMAMQLPAPITFEAIDLIFAYIPMAWLATKLGGKDAS